jgi:N-acetylglucosaminyl-diphospho-decaprenol L-rhamnosyltransferase
MLPALLDDIRRLWNKGQITGLEIQLTFNLASEDRGWLIGFEDLPLHVHVNPSPIGFGANQNAAFLRTSCAHFAIINPDIRMLDVDLAVLQHTLTKGKTGAVAPRIIDSNGFLQDSARHFPTISGVVKRAVTGRRKSEFLEVSEPINVDWVAGMFVLFRKEAWEKVHGFDENYFMYFEDVDICRRLRRDGWEVKYDCRVTVRHDAQRASHRDLQHLLWHMRSAVRYFVGL